MSGCGCLLACLFASLVTTIPKQFSNSNIARLNTLNNNENKMSISNQKQNEKKYEKSNRNECHATEREKGEPKNENKRN